MNKLYLTWLRTVVYSSYPHYIKVSALCTNLYGKKNDNFQILPYQDRSAVRPC